MSALSKRNQLARRSCRNPMRGFDFRSQTVTTQHFDILIHAPPETVWTAYVDHATEWFTPRPWTTPKVDYDLRPGGRADVTMRSPGAIFPPRIDD